MKKITFILFALIAGTTFAQNSSATAPVNAEIVTPIKIELVQNLEFGLIASDGLIANSVIVSDAGVRNIISGITLAGGATPREAIFQISAGNNAYSVLSIVENDLTIVGGGAGAATMDLTLTNNLDSTTDKLHIGGQLDVKVGQTAGSYEGEVKVTVAYN